MADWLVHAGEVHPNGDIRIKVHLSSITWAQIDQVAGMDGVLEAVVQGTGRDGGPSCASVPLVGGGWAVRRA